MAKGWSFGALTAALKDAAFYSRLDIINAILPVGIELQFGAAVNPNTLYPGTSWTQIVDGRVVRSATINSTVDTGSAGQIGQIGGSDTVDIAIANLPSHTHSMATHTHSVPAHAHTMAHTHSIPAHTHTGSTSSAGEHVHGIENGTNNGQGALDNWKSPGGYTNSRTRSAGSHTHTVSIDSGGAGSTDGSSADNTGTQDAMTTGVAGATATGAVGSDTALTVSNPFRRVAIWRRTA